MRRVTCTLTRIVIAAVLSIAAITPGFSADRSGRVRNATPAEIRAHINEAGKQTTTGRNGYTYQAGSRRGYKISAGRICILFPDKREDCAAIKTNGTDFQMITSDGTRSKF